MSRSGYSEDFDSEIGWLYRGQVASAIRGKRGQAFLRELLRALDALPEKRLIDEDLNREGAVCALGAVALARGMEVSGLDPENGEQLAEAFGIARPLVLEIEYENDEGGYFSYTTMRGETPEQRFARMRQWVVGHIKPTEAELLDLREIEP